MPTNESVTPPGAVKNNILGVLALAVAALDFTTGTRIMIIAGVFALSASIYSFAKAAGALRTPRKAIADQELRR